jgi:hypothetical protein
MRNKAVKNHNQDDRERERETPLACTAGSTFPRLRIELQVLLKRVARCGTPLPYLI